jgi:hypothetical protein
MAERMKAAVLKTASPKGDGGSNPSPSAKTEGGRLFSFHVLEKLGILIYYRVQVRFP